jgi:hypothetical protein
MLVRRALFLHHQRLFIAGREIRRPRPPRRSRLGGPGDESLIESHPPGDGPLNLHRLLLNCSGLARAALRSRSPSLHPENRCIPACSAHELQMLTKYTPPTQEGINLSGIKEKNLHLKSDQKVIQFFTHRRRIPQ